MHNIKSIQYVSVSQGDIHTKFTWQKFNKNILETDLLNLSNPEKSVVSAGKLFKCAIFLNLLSVETKEWLVSSDPDYNQNLGNRLTHIIRSP